jgi:hypothetical protein
MQRILAIVAVAAAAAVSLAVPGAGATTALSNAYAVAGIETSFPTNNTSTFAGFAFGSSGDTAHWKASVVHQGLSNCPFGSGKSCAITGGTFSLMSFAGGQLTGSFSPGGSVTPGTQQTPCGPQVFGVSGPLATNHGPAFFVGTLTHYRTVFFGVCVPFFATITGSVQLA